MQEMQSYQPRTRLFVDVPALHVGQGITLGSAETHYLRSVLRAKIGQVIEIFNGTHGGFTAEIRRIDKTSAQLELKMQTRAQEFLPKLSLAFAILKKDRVHMVVEKAIELGAARIVPVITERTQGQAVKQLKIHKLDRYVIEAAEQCGRTALAQLEPPHHLTDLLAEISPPDCLLYADEMRAGESCTWPAPAGWTTLLTGPEGGFSKAERQALRAHQAAAPITLGPRILRAETAAAAALSLWQHKFGDWR